MVWTEGVPMSRLQSLTPLSFKRLNPDWQIILHLIRANELGENTYTPNYDGPDYFNRALDSIDIINEVIIDKDDKHGILLSDIIRVQKLYEQGGVYSDFDVIWLERMSDFPYSDFETTLCYHPTGHINQSVIVSEPGGGFLRKVLEEQMKLRPPYEYQAFNTDLLLRLFPDKNQVNNEFPRVQIIPYELFYPYSIYELEKLYTECDLTPLESNPHCIHWFNGHEFSREYSDDNSFSRKCSMSTILRITALK